MSNAPAAKGSFSKAKDRASDKHPAYKGSVTFAEDIPAGTKLWLSGWVNTGEDGSQYVSIQLQFPLEKSSGGTTGGRITQPSRARPQRESIEDSEIPF